MATAVRKGFVSTDKDFREAGDEISEGSSVYAVIIELGRVDVVEIGVAMDAVDILLNVSARRGLSGL